jgi:hypothetical protein
MNQESRTHEGWNALSPTRYYGPEPSAWDKPIHFPAFLIDLYV